VDVCADGFFMTGSSGSHCLISKLTMLQFPSLPPMVRTILVYGGWFILPNWATNTIVVLYTRLMAFIKPNYIPPARGSPQAATIWRYCYTFVMASYLIVTTVHAFLSMSPNFYEILGVRPDANEQALKAAFRTFARRNHPDRVGPRGAPLFIAVRDAYEALNNPSKRFAYDRFGPDAMTWKDCVTAREYLKHGLLASSGYYIGTIALLVIWSVFGVGDSGTYWRNLLLCTVFFLELYLIINSPGTISEDHSFLQLSMPFRTGVPYQYTLFLHQLYMSLSIAIARIIPVLFPTSTEASCGTDHTMKALKPLIDGLTQVAVTTDREVYRMLSAEIRAMHGAPALLSALDALPSANLDPGVPASESPFVPSDSTMASLTVGLENLIIDKQLQSHPVLRGYWEVAISRRAKMTSGELQGQNVRLPSPPKSLSPIEAPKNFLSLLSPQRTSIKEDVGHTPSASELPSPRPSPPREVVNPTPAMGYIRARSLSC